MAQMVLHACPQVPWEHAELSVDSALFWAAINGEVAIWKFRARLAPRKLATS